MKKRSKIQTFKRHAAGLIRASLLLILALSVALVLLVRSAVVRADDAMMDLGRHLMILSESGMGREGRGVLLNGQQLGFRVFTTEHDMVTALDYYESWCRGGDGDFGEQEAGLQAFAEDDDTVSLVQDRSWTDLTRRVVDGDMGFVACIKHGLPNASSETLSNAMMDFVSSRNLADLGQFHYASVQQVEEGTRVVAVWTEGDFFPMSMFPSEGDAPGFDLREMRRPPSGRRILSGGEIGNSETLTVFIECEESIEELSGFYRKGFVQQGWRVLDDSDNEEGHMFVVQKGAEMRVISISSESGERTVAIVTAD